MLWSSQYVVEHVSALALAVLLVAAARVAPRIGRFLYLALFAWACIVNWQTVLERPRVYLEYADLALLDVYRDFIGGFFAAHIREIVGTIATCQGLIALGLFVGGKPAHVALVGAVVFLIMIAPLGVGSGFPSTVIMAAGCLRLLLSPSALARSLPVQLHAALVARRAVRRFRRAGVKFGVREIDGRSRSGAKTPA